MKPGEQLVSSSSTKVLKGQDKSKVFEIARRLFPGGRVTPRFNF
jgi:hypothetical protein